ncbi:sugar-transfer associated ATP-grasp domain-containing protein [Hungatella hathewayi]
MSKISLIHKWVNAESKRSGKRKSTVLFNFIFNYIAFGVNPKEYYWFHFDGKTARQKKTFFTKQMFIKFLKRNNDPAFVQILNDKYIFSQTYAEFTGRKVIRNERYMGIGDLESILDGTDKLIYKPKNGSGGAGIQVFDKIDYSDANTLLQKLCALPEGVVEQWIQQNEVMSKPYPDAVNCIRVATLYRDGQCHWLGAVFTLGRNHAKITNSFQGALFGLINLETGIVTTDLCSYSDELFKEHPDTGFVARGFQVPYWKEILELTAKAAAVVPQVGYVGWDVAIAQNGPVLIEGNSVSAGYYAYQHYLLREDGIGSRAVWEPFIR